MSTGWKIALVIVLGLVGIWAVGSLVAMLGALFRIAIALAVVGGVGYLIYWISTGNKALPGTKRRPLP